MRTQVGSHFLVSARPHAGCGAGSCNLRPQSAPGWETAWSLCASSWGRDLWWQPDGHFTRFPQRCAKLSPWVLRTFDVPAAGFQVARAQCERSPRENGAAVVRDVKETMGQVWRTFNIVNICCKIKERNWPPGRAMGAGKPLRARSRKSFTATCENDKQHGVEVTRQP